MKQHSMNIAVTAVGGGVGQSIVKALQKTEYNVVGINSEVLGAGLYATHRSYLGLCARDPRFIERLIKICSKEKCTVLFPGIDAELVPLSSNAEKLKAANINPIVSDPSVVEICVDKLMTFEFLKNNSFPYPQTYRLKEYSNELDFPVILKPQKGGHRSIGEFKVCSNREFDWLTTSIDVNNYVVQEYIEGEEYTCGTVTLENRCVGAIVMKRELRSGDTVKAFVVKNEELTAFLKKVINVLKPFGACNVQLRVRENVPYIFEFNARCSGTTASRALAGFNEPKIICDNIFKGIRNPEYNIKEIAILRYWKELAVDYERINEMTEKGFTSNKEEVVL
jgi:carbamoyl-phosphate synthase large subunit